MSSEVLDADITALNRQFLTLLARHSAQGTNLSMRLNVPEDFLEQTKSISSSDLEKVAAGGIFLLQPLIDAATLKNAAVLAPEQSSAYVKSAARLKFVVGR